MIKYSFIIPVYNCEKYLQACVESILNQDTVATYEVILIDDGTKDRSGRIADELASKYDQVRTYHKENGGAASARNMGIEKANGQYVLFIDGDDTVDKELMHTIEQTMEIEQQALLVYGMSFDYYRNDCIVRNEVLSCKRNGVFSVKDILEDYEAFFYDNTLSSACNKVFSMEVIKNNGLRFQEGMTLYEDYEFVLRYLMYIQCVNFVNKPFYHYRQDLEQMHIHSRVKHLDSLKRNLSQLLDTSMTLSQEQQLMDVSANLYMQLLAQHLMIASYRFKEFKNALKIYCDNDSFKQVLSLGGRLSHNEENLLYQVQTMQFGKIYITFLQKKTVSMIKRIVKKILVGLKLRA